MHTLAETATLEKESVDVIFSEWMGYFLLFERMLPSVLSARDKCLKSQGIIIPCKCRILIACYETKGMGDSDLKVLEQ